MMAHLNEIRGTLTAHGEELGTIRRMCVDIAEQQQYVTQRLEGLTGDIAQIACELANIVSCIKRDDQGQEEDDISDGNGGNAPDVGEDGMNHDNA